MTDPPHPPGWTYNPSSWGERLWLIGEFPRWMFIACYNAARNNPYKKHHHPCYEFLQKWPDEKVKEVGRKQWEEIQARMEAVG